MAFDATSSNPLLMQAHLARQLCEAAKEGDMKKVCAALRRGAPINGTGPMEKHSALMFATLDGRLGVVKLLIRRKADVNHRNKYGDTALIWAATNGFRKVVMELLKAEAQVDIQNKHHVTALMEAANAGHKGIVKELLKARAKLHRNVTLSYAKKGGQEDIVQMIE